MLERDRSIPRDVIHDDIAGEWRLVACENIACCSTRTAVNNSETLTNLKFDIAVESGKRIVLLKKNVLSRLHQNWKDIYKNIQGMAPAFVAAICMKRFDSELFQL